MSIEDHHRIEIDVYGIKQCDTWLVANRPREPDSLLLSTGKGYSTFAHNGFITILKLHNIVVNMGVDRCLSDRI